MDLELFIGKIIYLLFIEKFMNFGFCGEVWHQFKINLQFMNFGFCGKVWLINVGFCGNL